MKRTVSITEKNGNSKCEKMQDWPQNFAILHQFIE